ncbi:MAG: hypothetical protein ABEK16_05075 [Candidatus Nanohalobium sp.]
MKPEKVFKRYDVRGRYPEELDEEFVERMGKSLEKWVLENSGEKVVVCRDNKESSESLKKSLVEGITSIGVDVVDAGVGPTDYTSFHGSREDAVSVQVTSSHMPLEFNGLKFMYPRGNGFLNDDLNMLEEFFHKEDFPDGNGDIRKLEEPGEDYIEDVVEYVRQKGGEFDRRVVVDSMGGATRNFLPEVLERLGFDVIDLAEGREGIYRNPPDPRPEILGELAEKVEEEDAYMGLATDLDGDRVQVYFDGDWISGDDLFCIFAQLFSGEVVASVDTSKNLEEFADKVHYTRVGDPFVVDRMLKEGAVLSGEPNGHYCFPELINYNSGTLAGALAASIDFDGKLEKVPESFLEKENVEYDDRNKRNREMKKFRTKAVSELDIDSTADGVKFTCGDASVLVRPSGSSPKIRVKSQAPNKEGAENGLAKALDIIGKE